MFISGSAEGNRKTVRCYICGEEFAPHYINVHERQCKRKWDSGVTNSDNLKKGASLGHIPAVREIERGKQKDPTNSENIRKAQSVASLAQHGPKQAWNARMRDKGSKENISKDVTKKRPMRKERPKSAHVKSMSTQNLDQSLFSGKEFGIYDDSMENEKMAGFGSEKAVSMQDLSSSLMKKEEIKPKTPKFIECQYCFKMFSIHSIYIHEKKCLCRGSTEKDSVKVRPKRKPRQNGRCVSVNELHVGNGNDDWSIEAKLSRSLAISSDNVNSPKQVANNDSPRFLLCSFCGKPFGSKSLPIHLPQCQRRYERENGSREVNGFGNRLMNRVGGRDLLPEKVPLRQTVSSPVSPTERTPSRKSTKSTPMSTSATPNNTNMTTQNRMSGSSTRKASSSASAYVACQFCNNYYGSASVKIHESKCSAKMKREDEKLLAKPGKRNLGRLFGLQR